MNKIPTFLRDETADGDQGGSSAATQDVFEPAVSAPDQPTQSSEPPKQEPQQQVPMSAEQLQTLITKSYELAARKTQQPQPAAQAPVQPVSDDELFSHFGMPKIDEAMYTAIVGLKPEKPEQVSALSNLMRSAIWAAAKMANAHFSQRFQDAEQRIQPHIAYLQELRGQREEESFFSRHEDLRPHVNLLRMVRDDAFRRGVRFDTVEEAENFLVKKATEVLDGIRGGGQSGTAPKPTGNQNQKKQGMTPTNLGGQSSHGRGTSDPQKVATALASSLEVFDD